MKALSTLALVAVLLVLADTIVPGQAVGWSWLPSSRASDEKKAADDSAKKDDVALKDEEVVAGVGRDVDLEDEKQIDIVDQDYMGQSSSSSSNKPQPSQAALGSNAPAAEEPIKYNIPADEMGDEELVVDGLPTSGIATINSLPPQNGSTIQYGGYDRVPQQSPFVDGAPHPTESREIDPRFNTRPRRQCQEDQYLCQKASPQQEHVRCIPNEWKCNGVRDCENNDDEEGCAINNHRATPNACNPTYQYTCYGSGINGLPAACIDKRKLCDGTYDCSYGDDEAENNCAGRSAAPRREEVVVQPPQPGPPEPQSGPPEPSTRPAFQNAPPQYANAYDSRPAPPPSVSLCHGKNEDYVKRLEWTDRCIRTCMGRALNNYGKK